jgi:hypothetical protein
MLPGMPNEESLANGRVQMYADILWHEPQRYMPCQTHGREGLAMCFRTAKQDLLVHASYLPAPLARAAL